MYNWMKLKQALKLQLSDLFWLTYVENIRTVILWLNKNNNDQTTKWHLFHMGTL